ncbi:glycosyltransferase [Stenotrophomonas sp. HITSZ_GD]|uniref:glycosyltransferase n=1 Tax=Stenotrophomonas sp. HITSZ_GD TaxID=3037248 RepID=UPI00240D5A40|nr:glycosyltransferase [Stenotrophomonas sp. HITSZ_GD]MDG2525930.1 glycosyltransferase [Stenotrophomonas sp. HITSZ_GD]
MIAVLVPAHNEVRRIGACLRAIAAAAADPAVRDTVEVFVALDRCTDGTAAVVAQMGAHAVLPAGSGVGAARAAAAEAALARGATWLAHTDADSRVPRHWLAAQLACRADVFCGPVRVARWRDYCDATRRAFEHWERIEDGHPHVHGANLGCSAAAYLAVGGMGAQMTGEDVDFVRRATEHGLCIARRGDPCVQTSARRNARAPAGFSHFLAALEASVSPAGTPAGPG